MFSYVLIEETKSCCKQILVCYIICSFSTKVWHNTWLGKDSDCELHLVISLTKLEEKKVGSEKTHPFPLMSSEITTAS